MKAYIAGKITGDENYKKKFECAQKCLEAEGFILQRVEDQRLLQGQAESDCPILWAV